MSGLRVLVCGDPALAARAAASLAGRFRILRDVVSDAPGADAAVVYLDAGGATPEIRRQCRLLALMRVPQVAIATDSSHSLDGLTTLAPASVPAWLEKLPPGGEAPPPRGEVADQFEATVIWLGKEPLLGGRGYLLQASAGAATAVPNAPKFRLDPETHEHLAARTLEAGDIGVCNLALDHAIAFEPYAEDRERGSFRLVDRETGEMVGAGLLHFALRRAHNIHPHSLAVDRAARARLKGQRPAVIWLTGLSGAGKSTIANLVDRALHAQGRHTYVLDGDNVRHGLNRDLGFTAADRVENVRRVAEVAKLLADAGLIVLVSLISPYRSERRAARELFPAGEFIEVFVDAPLALAEQRDPKGLYGKARRGELKNFTGIDSPYEAPEAPELRLDTATTSPSGASDKVLEFLHAEHII